VVIFFDIDGTLLDYESAEETGAVRFFLEHKNVFSMSEPEFLKIWSTLRTKHFERYLRKEVSFAGQRRARIQELYGAMGHLLSDEEADLQFGTYLEHYNRAWKPYDDVIPCLTKLEGFKLGIITNGDYNHQMHKLQRLSIQRFFSLIIASGEVGYSKPDKRIFINACSKADPGDVAYIGDTPHDIEDSREVGTIPLGAVWAGTARTKGVLDKRPTEYFTDVSEFIKWIEDNVEPNKG
jgi:putative hydrolase of the HAD superfamily